MLTVFLVRHCMSETNAGLSTLGPENVGLTPHGVEQAKSISNFLRDFIPIDLIVTSRYQRTKQTAAPTVSTFPVVLEEEWEIEEFTYLSSFHHEFCTAEDRRPLVDAYWEQCNPDFIESEGSESFRCFIARVKKILERLQEAEQKTIVIFSHDQFICALLWLLTPDSGSTLMTKEPYRAMHAYKDFLDSCHIPNGGIVHMHYFQQQNQWDYRLMTEHLEIKEEDKVEEEELDLVDTTA
jgi:probable phosphoglycerate mutase